MCSSVRVCICASMSVCVRVCICVCANVCVSVYVRSNPENSIPVIILGDLNLPPESPQFSRFTSLLQSFILTLSSSPATHKAGNQPDLLFTRSCSTTQLMVSTHQIISVSFSLSYPVSHKSSSTSPTVTIRRNPHSPSLLPHLFYSLHFLLLPLSQNCLPSSLPRLITHASPNL